jgi:hypothetical protein
MSRDYDEKFPYVLEVLKFGRPYNTHVGYMDKLFKTKQEAINYYNLHNSHMRRLNAFGASRSDWDPNTQLLYVVRESYFEQPTIPAWD